ncbi:hypothetical protein E8E14_005909 [Neopestalotiopsis sp. 37M]|nr:hypothetical protein E8E14_005909 [Neopestalotiopsis sp. 37M]
MAWNREPEESAIQTLLEWLNYSLTRKEAIARLKSNEGNIENAVTEYYNDPADPKYNQNWDDSLFTADREGGQNTAGVQFNIQGPDITTSHFDISSGAPTRPPSRVNNRSPMGAPTTQADEDADLQRALRESAAISGLPPQESGIIGSDVTEKKFGPATRAEYEQDQWAMVPTKLAALNQQRMEIPPSDRKRADAAPAFLRSSQNHRLGGLVSILAQIPLARNGLLSLGEMARTHNYDNEWWQGKQAGHAEFHDEVHCLVAFLDGTERAYGSADSLASALAVKEVWETHDYEDTFFKALKEEYHKSGKPVLKAFFSVAKTVPMFQSDNEKLYEAMDIDMLTVPLAENQNQGINTLYNALDTMFWYDALRKAEPETIDTTSFFTDPADILVIRIGGDGLCKPLDVPMTLYLDRYEEARRQDALTIQKEIVAHKFGLYKLKASETQMGDTTEANGDKQMNWLQGQYSLRQRLERSIAMLGHFLTQQRQWAQLRFTDQKCQRGEKVTDDYQVTICSEKTPYEFTEAEQRNEENLKTAIAKAQEQLTKLDGELKYVKDCIKYIEDGLDHLGLKFTVREDEASEEFVNKYIHIRDPEGIQPEIYEPNAWNPSHKYLLSGVATTNEITYVCSRRPPPLIETDDAAEQWWRLVYAADEKTPVSVEKTDAESVLIAAGSESKFPIMVYASKTALETEPIQLSEALRTFVRADNKVFQKELSSEEAQTSTQPQSDATLRLTAETIEAIPEAEEMWGSKGKRKLSPGSSIATIDSGDSRDVNMAFSGGTPLEGLNEHYGDLRGPTAQPAKIGNLVQSLEKCQTSSDSAQDQAMGGVIDDMAKSPEMQERAGSHSPFMMRRPVETASQAALTSVGPTNMDEMEVEVEHHEG